MILPTVFIFCSVFGCKPFASDSIKNTDRIVFFVFNFKKFEGAWNVSIIQEQIVSGKLKSLPTAPMYKTDIAIDCLDKNKRVLNTYYTNDPFSKLVEFVNDNGSFERKQIEVDESQVMIRLIYNTRIRYFRFKRQATTDSSEVILQIDKT